jgi:hypothetical protein
MLPEGITIQFQPELYKKLTNFIETSDPRLIFVYGEYDPWTSVGITKLDGKKNMFVAIQRKGVTGQGLILCPIPYETR